jgi:6-pyruvoyltetrahydropterin/6-carboxytetrahydropterin synthase
VGAQTLRVGIRACISAAHYIKNYAGKCAGLHGHNYVVEVVVEGRPDERGMVVDFVELKRLLAEVLSAYDHKVLNDVLGTQNATAEALALDIARRLRERLPEGLRLRLVRVYETQDTWVEVQESPE